MLKIEKLHRQFEKTMESKQCEPTRMSMDDIADSLAEDGVSSLFDMLVETKKMLEIIMPSQETLAASWKYSGSYYNTITSFTKHEAKYSAKPHIRMVVANEKVKIEFKQVSDEVVELNTIKLSKEFRRTGLGKDIMENLMKIAQRLSFDLILVPVAFDSSIGSYKEFFKETLRLRKWYYDLGFEYQKDSAIMVW